MVGSLYYEPSGADAAGPTILIDPLAPPAGTPDADRFWKALDEDVQRRNKPVAVLLGVHDHERSAQAVVDRYAARGVTLVAHEAARSRISCRITHPVTASTTLPGPVEVMPVAGIEPSELAFWIPAHRALIFSDAVIGTGGTGGTGGAGPGRLRIAPESWAPHTPEGAERYHREFRASLREFLSLPIELLIVSHGDPVKEGAVAALAEALDSPAWGDQSTQA